MAICVGRSFICKATKASLRLMFKVIKLWDNFLYLMCLWILVASECIFMSKGGKVTGVHSGVMDMRNIRLQSLLSSLGCGLYLLFIYIFNSENIQVINTNAAENDALYAKEKGLRSRDQSSFVSSLRDGDRAYCTPEQL